MTGGRSERHQKKPRPGKLAAALAGWLSGSGRPMSSRERRLTLLTVVLAVAVVAGNLLIIPLLDAWLPDHIGELFNMPNTSISSTDWLETETTARAAFPFDQEETPLSPLTDGEKLSLKEADWQTPAFEALWEEILGEYVELTDAEGILPGTRFTAGDWTDTPRLLSAQTALQLAADRRPGGAAGTVPDRWIVTRAQARVSSREDLWWLDVVSHPTEGILYCRLYPQEELSGYLTLDDNIRQSIAAQSNAFLRKLLAANADAQQAHLGVSDGQQEVYGIRLLATYGQTPDEIQTQGMTCVLTYLSSRSDSYFLVYYDMSLMQVSGFSFNYGR